MTYSSRKTTSCSLKSSSSTALLRKGLSKEPKEEKDELFSSFPKKKVIVIGGPTASGKSDLALKLAQALGGEIISADSCQVYRGMDIGTAKPSPEERAQITHHLIDICDLDHSYNVVEFYEDARRAIQEVIKRGNVPIVVGGSGFYLHTLLYGPPLGPPSSEEVRKHLDQQMQELGAEVLYEKVQMLDPIYAATISEKDRYKIIRALEIMTLSEQRVSDFAKPSLLQEDLYDFRTWFIHHPREKLYERIEKRCDEMIQKGFLEEVKSLEANGLRENRAASQAIGYRQALTYWDSAQTEKDLEEFVSSFKKASRHFAKRQFTWFRKEPLFRWLDCSLYSQESLKELILQDFEQGV